MKTTIIIIFTTMLLAGCSNIAIKPSDEAYASDEVYQGYPCSPNCQDFQKGFDAAKDHKLTIPNQCQGQSMAETTGCKAYVNEYQFENQTYYELIGNQ